MAATLTITAGPGGTGKSYKAVHDTLTKHWPEGRRVITNIPMYPDKMREYYGKDSPGVTVFEVPASWKNLDLDGAPASSLSGPWNFELFEGDISNTVIIIDEAHNFIRNKQHAKRWGVWIGEIRHRGARVELLTQATAKLPTEILREAQDVLLLSSMNRVQEPITGLRMGDLYQIVAKIQRRPCRITRVTTEERNGRRTRTVDKELIRLKPEIFALYNSYNAPEAGGQAGKETEVWERRSLPWLIFAAFANSTWPVLIRVVGVGVFVWLFPMGGASKFFKGITTSVAGAIGSSGRAASSPSSPSGSLVEVAGDAPPDTGSLVPGLQTRLVALGSDPTMPVMFSHGVGRVGERIPGMSCVLLGVHPERGAITVASVGTVFLGESFVGPAWAEPARRWVRARNPPPGGEDHEDARGPVRRVWLVSGDGP